MEKKWYKTLHWYLTTWEKNEAWIVRNMPLLQKIQQNSDDFGWDSRQLTHGERSVLLTHTQYYRHSLVHFHRRKERGWNELIQLTPAGEWILRQIALGKSINDSYDKSSLE